MTSLPDDARPAAADDGDSPELRAERATAIPAVVAGQSLPSPNGAILDYEPPREQSLTRRARDGALWSVGGTVLMLGSTLIAQVVVGNVWKTEYALNTVLVTVTMISALFRDAGIRKMALASGSNYPNVARQLQQLNWILNIAAGVIVFAIAPLLARYAFDQPHPELIRLLWILAITFAAGPAWMMQWVSLALDLRFRTTTIMALCSFLIRNGSLILLVKCGATELALVLPGLFSSTFESVAGRLVGGRLPAGPNLTWQTAISTLMTSRWVILGVFGSILTTRADTFFVGRLGGFDFATDVAAYAFASLLAFSALTPFIQIVQGTLTPIFVRLTAEPERLGNAFERVVGVAAVVGTSVWLPAMFVSGPMMHLLWRGKWDHAVPIVVALLCMLIPKSLQAAALALDESRGRFRGAALLITLDGLTTVAIAFAAGLRGSPVLLAAAVSAHHVVFCLFHVLRVGRRACAHDPRASLHILERVLGPTLVGIAALAVTSAIERILTGHWAGGISPLGLVWGTLSVTLFAAGIRLLQPARYHETLDLVLRRGSAR